MRVALKQNWFGPDAVLYVRSIVGTIIPDDLRDVLPESAKVLDEDEAPSEAPVAEPVQTLASFDEERQAEEVAEAVIEKAEATRVAGGRKPPRHG